MNIFSILKHATRIFVIFLSVLLILHSAFSIYSVYLIVSDPEDNIKVPDGNITYNFNVFDWNHLHFTLPFSITNKGFYNIQDIYIYINLTAIYGNQAKLIFSKYKSFGNISAGQTLKSEYKVGPNDFLQENVIEILHQTFRNPGPIEFRMDILVGGRYSLSFVGISIQTQLVF